MEVADMEVAEMDVSNSKLLVNRHSDSVNLNTSIFVGCNTFLLSCMTLINGSLRTYSFNARSSTFYNYKKYNTIKFLVGITPNGCVSFLSKCWGGSVSDKQLTQECGFLDKLTPGDTILADRGFTIEEVVAIHRAKLEIPAFTRRKKQLSQRVSQQLSRVRIHVERVIGLIKNKYTILKGPLPVDLLKHQGDENVANIDEILTICAALCNFSNSIVKIDW